MKAARGQRKFEVIREGQSGGAERLAHDVEVNLVPGRAIRFLEERGAGLGLKEVERFDRAKPVAAGKVVEPEAALPGAEDAFDREELDGALPGGVPGFPTELESVQLRVEFRHAPGQPAGVADGRRERLGRSRGAITACTTRSP